MKLGIKAYARHRKDRGLPGGSPAAVRKALDRGQIRKTLDDLIDTEEADREWPGDEPARVPVGGEPEGGTEVGEGGTGRGNPPRGEPPSGDRVERRRAGEAVPPWHPRARQEEDDGGESEGRSAEPGGYAAARIRKETALAQLRELEVAQLLEELIPVDLHEERVQSLCERLASRVRSLTRYQGDVQRATTDLEAAELLERMIEELLQALMGIADELEDDVEEDEEREAA